MGLLYGFTMILVIFNLGAGFKAAGLPVIRQLNSGDRVLTFKMPICSHARWAIFPNGMFDPARELILWRRTALHLPCVGRCAVSRICVLSIRWLPMRLRRW